MAAVVAAQMALCCMVDQRDAAELAYRNMAAGKAEDASRKTSSVLQENDLLVFFKAKFNLSVE